MARTAKRYKKNTEKKVKEIAEQIEELLKSMRELGV